MEGTCCLCCHVTSTQCHSLILLCDSV
jgi:hypothetical protein